MGLRGQATICLRAYVVWSVHLQRSLGNSWQIPLKWELPLQLVPCQGFTLGQSWKWDIAMGLLIVRWRCPNVGMWEEGGAN